MVCSQTQQFFTYRLAADSLPSEAFRRTTYGSTCNRCRQGAVDEPNGDELCVVQAVLLRTPDGATVSRLVGVRDTACLPSLP